MPSSTPWRDRRWPSTGADRTPRTSAPGWVGGHGFWVEGVSTNVQGESFRYAVVMIQADDGGEPSGELRLQLTGAGSEDLPDLRVGGTAEFDDWTLTIHSICADEVGFDAEITD